MADPKKYTPSYNYSDYQAANPTRPLPAPRVDIDFADIADSIGQTIDGLKDLRRSDGELKRVVGPEQLKEPLFTQFQDLTDEANDAANRAKNSATAAKNSEDNAKTSESNAAASETAAAASANAAATSESNAAASETAAAASASNAASSENNAASSAQAALESENNAAESEGNAAASAAFAEEQAQEAEYYTAKMRGGNTGQILAKASDEDGDYLWADVTGGGDMLKTIYDRDDDGIVDRASSVDWSGVENVPLNEPGGVAVLDENGKIPEGNLPDLEATYLAKAGGTMEGLLTAWAGSDDRIMLPGQGTYPNVAINYSGAGNVGFYDRDNFKWLLRVDHNGVMRDVQIPSGLIQDNPVFNGHEMGLVMEEGAIRFTSNSTANFLQSGTSLSSSFKPLYITAAESSSPIAAVLQDRVNVPRLRITATDDLSPTSTNHGFQIGPDNGLNLGIDNNEIICRNNGVINSLGINETLNINSVQISVSSGRNVNFRNAGWVDVPTPTGANQAATKAYVDSRPAWPGVYTGTAHNNTNFPVGTYLIVTGSVNPTRNGNVTMYVYSRDGNTQRYSLSDKDTSGVLAGVWRNRGYISSSDIRIVQRVS